MSNIIGYVVFTDLKGFSKMNEPEIFFEHTIRPLAKNLRKFKYKAEVWNTWGDALVAVFLKGIDAVELMIEYRDYFRKNKLLSLQPRIAGHYGQMLMYNDPLINNRDNVLGDTVNKAARIEPITFPGEIYVSDEFKKHFIEEMDKAPELEKESYSQVRFTDLKKWSLPKNDGIMHLYRLFHESEEAWNINSLFIKNDNENIDHLFNLLNIEDKIKKARENKDIVEAKQKNNKEEIQEIIDLAFNIKDDDQEETKEQKKISGPLYIALAELFRDIGEYKKALICINKAQDWQMDMSINRENKEKENKYWTSSLHGVKLKPFAENIPTLKLKADILSKAGQYERAKEILIKILQQNTYDTDVLTKLAAQLKREAFQPEQSKEGRKDLLEEALYLYLEAFRRERDYYPAINASYIEKLLKRSNGWHLASYIFNTWNHKTGENWWLDSTLAETQLLLGEFKFCYQRMERAITKHNPAFFERHATRDQISNFVKFYKVDLNSLPEIEDMRYAALLSILLYDPNLIKDYKEKIMGNEDKAEEENQVIVEKKLVEELYEIVLAKNENMIEVLKDVFKENNNVIKESNKEMEEKTSLVHAE